MKKIILICFLVSVYFTSVAQYPLQQNLGSSSTLVNIPANGAIRGGLIPISFTDTVAANLTNIKFYDGALIKTTSPIIAIWYRVLVNQQWIQILPSGGSAGQRSWLDGGNANVLADGFTNGTFGTLGLNGIKFSTNSIPRFILGNDGIRPDTGTTSPIGVGADGYLHYTSGGGGAGWGLSGNALVGGEFLGSTNAEDVVLKRNSVETFRLKSGGALQAVGYGGAGLTGTASTYPAFDVSGNLIQSATPYTGINIYNSDGTLTGNRTITNAGYWTKLSGTGFLGVGRTPTTLLDLYRASGAAEITLGSGNDEAHLIVNGFSLSDIRMSVDGGATYGGIIELGDAFDIASFINDSLVNINRGGGHTLIGKATFSPNYDSAFNVNGGAWFQGGVRATGLTSGAGTKALRINPGTGLITYADTTAGGGGSGTVTNVSSANADITVATGTTTPVITMVQAPALRSATTTVNVSSATAPTSGQVLTATSGTAATWQTPSGGSGITVGTTTITSGTSGRVGYNNAGVYGEYPITGTGNVMLSASPTTTGTLTAAAITASGAITGRWTARVGSTTSSATPTINTDNVDIYKLTAQTADITSMTTNLSGTPVDGDILEIQITGTAARAITWGSSFVSSTVTLPTTTVTTATLTTIFQYFTTSSYGNNKWVCVNYF